MPNSKKAAAGLLAAATTAVGANMARNRLGNYVNKNMQARKDQEWSSVVHGKCMCKMNLEGFADEGKGDVSVIYSIGRKTDDQNSAKVSYTLQSMAIAPELNWKLPEGALSRDCEQRCEVEGWPDAAILYFALSLAEMVSTITNRHFVLIFDRTKLLFDTSENQEPQDSFEEVPIRWVCLSFKTTRKNNWTIEVFLYYRDGTSKTILEEPAFKQDGAEKNRISVSGVRLILNKIAQTINFSDGLGMGSPEQQNDRKGWLLDRSEISIAFPLPQEEKMASGFPRNFISNQRMLKVSYEVYSSKDLKEKIQAMAWQSTPELPNKYGSNYALNASYIATTGRPLPPRATNYEKKIAQWISAPAAAQRLTAEAATEARAAAEKQAAERLTVERLSPEELFAPLGEHTQGRSM